MTKVTGLQKKKEALLSSFSAIRGDKHKIHPV